MAQGRIPYSSVKYAFRHKATSPQTAGQRLSRGNRSASQEGRKKFAEHDLKSGKRHANISATVALAYALRIEV